jgi:hypothetical protein
VPTNATCHDTGDITQVLQDEGDLDQDGDYTETVPFDLRGGARIQGATVDLGALEVAP